MILVTIVTGGSGYLGSYVLESALNSGETTICFSNAELSRPLRSNKTPIMLSGDILNISELIRVVRDYDVSRIIHLAGLISSSAQKNPSLATHVNCVGTMNVLECARLAGIRRVVFASSTQVYGYSISRYTDRIIDEDVIPDPASVYGATKLYGEKLGASYADTYGIEFVALRMVPCYGFGNVNSRTHLVDNRVERTQRIIELPLAGKPVKIEKGGLDPMDFVYVEDAAASIVRASTVPSLPHKIYLISSGELHSMDDFKKVIKNYVPDANIEIGPETDPLYKPSPAFSTARARGEIGHEPSPFSERITQYIELAKSIISMQSKNH